MKTNQPFKILIADDDTDDLHYLKFLFKNHKGFEVLDCLTSGRAVLETIQQSGKAPDVLLIDMYMPVLTGAEVVRTLLEQQEYSDTAFFIISTSINRTEEERFNGRVHFLEKPSTLVQINDLPELLLEKMDVANINRI